MARWVRTATAIAAGMAAGSATVAVATRRWDRATARALRRLHHASEAQPIDVRRFDPAALESLPAPVARYFAFALTPGQRLIRGAHVRHAGSFRARGDAWGPFTSVQHYTVHPPGFVWDASIAMGPMLRVRVRDSYVAGVGGMHARAAAVAPLVNERGTPELASGALVRYLAECVWLPTALLPHAGVSWEALDDESARATLTDGETTVSLDVHFGVHGEIVRGVATRYRNEGGMSVLRDWVCHHREYRRVDGMMIPMAGEAAWRLPERRVPYWRGRIASVFYEY